MAMRGSGYATSSGLEAMPTSLVVHTGRITTQDVGASSNERTGPVRTSSSLVLAIATPIPMPRLDLELSPATVPMTRMDD